MDNNIKSLLEETGHLVKNKKALPKRDGYHYEMAPYDDKKGVAAALHNFVSGNSYDHWYSDGKTLYFLVKDSENPEAEERVREIAVFNSDEYEKILRNLREVEPFARYMHTNIVDQKIEEDRYKTSAPLSEEKDYGLIIADEKHRLDVRARRYQEQILHILGLWDEIEKKSKKPKK